MGMVVKASELRISQQQGLDNVLEVLEVARMCGRVQCCWAYGICQWGFSGRLAVQIGPRPWVKGFGLVFCYVSRLSSWHWAVDAGVCQHLYAQKS